MKKEHQIIMLPSENWSSIVLSNKGELEYTYGEKVNGFQKNLYILSDEEINKGDWVVFRANGRVDGEWILDQARADGQAYKIQRKIIATTDAELLPYGYSAMEAQDEGKYYPAFISQHIIKAYVKKPFDEVEVEYLTKLKKGTDLGYECNYIVPDKPKLNQDGTLAVSLVEEKSELDKCKESLWYFMTNYATIDGKPFKTSMSEEECEQWIKENL